MSNVSPPFDPWLWSVGVGEIAWASVAGAQALQGLQERRLRTLVESAVRGSPLFRRMLSGVNPASVRLQELPVTRKHDLMAHFDEWVTDPQVTLESVRRFVADSESIAKPYLERYMVWHSSGSTGQPAIYLQDGFAMNVYDVLEAMRRSWPMRRWFDPWYLGERIALVGAIGGHFASIVSVKRLCSLNPAFAAKLATVSFLRPTQEVVAELNAIAPTVVSTYPSTALLLAEEQAAGRLKLRLREVWTGGETLTPAMRSFVQRAFDCTVVNSYGASEFLSIASECRCGRLHVNSDWVILESVDEHGCGVPAGTLGATTLLTNLANRVQPLIRYDLGDRIVIHPEPCECGSALPVVDVLGRDAGVLHLGLKEHQVTVSPLAISTVLEDEAGLFNFQLRQLGPLDVELAAPAADAPARELLRRAGKTLEAFLRREGAGKVRVSLAPGHALVRNSPGGKMARVLAPRVQHLTARRHKASRQGD